MKDILEYEPKQVWNFFKQISDVPRESEKEEKIRKYLIDTAEKYNIEYKTDKIGNVYYYKKPSKGFENTPSVALQGHMDMVCVKTEDSNHNFDTDPLTLFVDGDYLKAKNTTLGADNGIAVAMILAIFTDPNAKHGPLEAIITVAEETGLTGAENVNPDFIKSKMMINLDSEDEGVIYIGCAGGIEVDATKKLKYEAISKDDKSYSLVISNLLGGHSGAEIHTQRANALKLASIILFSLNEKEDVKINSFKGGTKRNVIPSSCVVNFSIKKDFDVNKILDDCKKTFKDIYEVSDPNIKITLKETSFNKVLSKKESKQIINALFTTPHGVVANSTSLKGVVETSCNLAIVNISEDDNLLFIESCRSSIEGSRDLIAKEIATIWKTIDKSLIKIHGAYPSWKPDLSLDLYKFCSKAYEDYTGKKALITAIHAGLECGIINSRINNLDSVSFGPNIKGAHSTEERLSIKSTQNIYGFLLHLLTIIK